MKKLLFLLLITAVSYGQTYQNPTFGTVTTKTSPTVTNDPYVTTTGTTGIQGKIAPVNLIIPHTPVNYTVPNLTIGAHLSGIDTRLGQISSTTAGLTQRIYFTADDTTVNSVVYFSSNSTGKGATAAGSPPALVLADNTKGYFTKDLISIPQPAATIGYAGSYSGNLTVSATPTPVATQQRFTVEVYRTNNLGTPIASGVSGAPVGDLGVTVVAILDSGIINLTAGSITNVSITGILTQNITINTGERLRYHVSAAKIGAGGGNVTFNVYYGSSYNSYYDVPVAITTDAVVNKSTVTGVTATDALNTLNTGKANDADVLHKTGSLTETVTGNKTLTGTNIHSGVNTFNNDITANGFISGTVNKVLPSGITSIGQIIDVKSSDNTSVLNNRLLINYNEDGIVSPSSIGLDFRVINNKTTNQPSKGQTALNIASTQNGSGSYNFSNVITASVLGSGTGAITNLNYYSGNISPFAPSYPITNFAGINLTNMPNITGGGITNSRAIFIGDVFGSTLARGIDTNVSSGTGKHNLYIQGTANNFLNGNTSIGATTDNGAKLQVYGTINASSGTARGSSMNNTLVATANNDVLVGLDINPTFTNGAFTGVNNTGIRVSGNFNTNRTILSNNINTNGYSGFTAQDNSLTRFLDIGILNSATTLGGGYGLASEAFLRASTNAIGLHLVTVNSTAPIRFSTNNGVERMRIFGATGNVLIQNGGTFSDAGYRLDVQGSARFTTAGIDTAYTSVASNSFTLGSRGTGTAPMLATRSTSVTATGFLQLAIQNTDAVRTGEADIVFRTGFEVANAIQTVTSSGNAFVFQNAGTSLVTISRQGDLNIKATSNETSFSSIANGDMMLGKRGTGSVPMIATRTSLTTATGFYQLAIQQADVARTGDADILFRTGYESGGVITTLTTGGSAFAFRNATVDLFNIHRNGQLQINTAPTTSVGAYDILTRNTSTGFIEKIPSSSVITGSGANTQVSFWNGTNSQSGDSNFIWDNGSKTLNISTEGSNNPFVIRMYSNSLAQAAGIIGIKYGGTKAAPTLTPTGSVLTGLYGQGYDGVSVGGNTAAIRLIAQSDFTSTSQPTYIDFATTAVNNTARVVRMVIDSGGYIQLNTTPLTAGATYDLLVRHTISGYIEKIPSNTYAVDADVVHKTGNESVSGIKSFSANTANPTIDVYKSSTSGTGVRIQTSVSNAGGTLLEVNSTNANSVTNVAKLLVLNAGADSVGMPLTVQNSGTDTCTITKAGVVTSSQYRISALNTAPSSSTDTGTTGEVRITAGFIYVCTATNTWVRTALSTF